MNCSTCQELREALVGAHMRIAAALITGKIGPEAAYILNDALHEIEAALSKNTTTDTNRD